MPYEVLTQIAWYLAEDAVTQNSNRVVVSGYLRTHSRAFGIFPKATNPKPPLWLKGTPQSTITNLTPGMVKANIALDKRRRKAASSRDTQPERGHTIVHMLLGQVGKPRMVRPSSASNALSFRPVLTCSSFRPTPCCTKPQRAFQVVWQVSQPASQGMMSTHLSRGDLANGLGQPC